MEKAVIFTDAKNVLMALYSPSIKKLPHISHQKQIYTRSDRTSTLPSFGPQSIGILANEIVDRLAKEAARTEFKFFFIIPI